MRPSTRQLGWAWAAVTLALIIVAALVFGPIL
jgi:hypothetical protein